MSPQESTLLFVSYSHKDAEFVKRIEVNLKPLVDWKQVELWVDEKKIASGDIWKEKINTALNRMAMGVALISDDYLASDFIKKFEIPAFLDAAKKGKKIFLLVVKPSRFKETELKELQTLNDPENPLSGVSENERERMYVQLALEIKTALLRQQRKPVAEVVNMNDQQDKLDFAIQSLLNTHERYFLMALGENNTAPLEFQDNFRDKDHLRRLRDLEFIQMIDNKKKIADLRRHEDLKKWFCIGDKGKTYLRYLKG